MASLFGHAFVSIALSTSFKKQTLKLIFLAIICAIIPDADVIGFSFDIPYQSFWGHRGFTHSFVFALLFAIFITL